MIDGSIMVPIYCEAGWIFCCGKETDRKTLKESPSAEVKKFE